MTGTPASVRFTEEMKGFVSFGETDFERGYEGGERADDELMFRLTIEALDIDRFVSDHRHEAVSRGWIGCEALGGRLPVERGAFNLFVAEPESPLKRMLYRLHFRDGVGHPLTLSGHKRIRPGGGLDVWPDTTTLYTRVLQGHVDAEGEPDAEPVASGILRITPRGFARQMTTFRATGASPRARAAALGRFGILFAGELADAYGDPRTLLSSRKGDQWR